MTDQPMKAYTIEELKALGVLNVGAKNDPSSTTDRKSTRLNSSHSAKSRMPSSA